MSGSSGRDFENATQIDPIWSRRDPEPDNIFAAEAWPFETPPQASPAAGDDIYLSLLNSTAENNFSFPPDFLSTDVNVFDFDSGNAVDSLPHGGHAQAETALPRADQFVVQDSPHQHGLVEAQASEGPRSRRKLGRGKHTLDWSAHKSTIRRLYLEEDNTLEETRQWMKREHGFDASIQMYKERFQDWGFVKKISHKVARKLSRIADERKPKETEFRLGRRTWTANEIKKKYSRGKEPGVTTMPGATPSSLASSTPRAHMENSNPHDTAGPTS
ncbi:Clr5 domain-containing protein [Stachybotrys elegans]|uniref:Clr5 domain-containing protein n=1 Tax=Stachybotrys elegans TaxID=80388 RepID=A0A8K0T2E1_9HYPO|nr:Clr5 domain-containing protein [Stachybotrys elegans]